MSGAESNKAQLAKRVVEVLEFFDDDHPTLTVMDIVRRHNRPQSSTSELLASLVSLGLLKKDLVTRSFTLTQRSALLCRSVQVGVVRDGRLAGLIERLSAQTGLGVALFGRADTNLQIFRWQPGKWHQQASQPGPLSSGAIDALADNTVGHLLISSLPQAERDDVLDRIGSRLLEKPKAVMAELIRHVNKCRENSFTIGAVGFGSAANTVAMLLPDQPAGQPLAIGLVYEPSELINVELLRDTLAEAMASCIAEATPQHDPIERIAVVA